MNKYNILISILFSTVCAFASDGELSISVNTMSMDYMEYKDNGDKFDSETANALPGFAIGYKTRINDGLDGDGGYIDAGFSHFYGDTTYIGSYQGGNYGDLTTITHNRISEATFGYSESKDLEQVLWSVRFGMGYRLWERELADGHNEQYVWPYGSISTGLSGNISTNDTLGILAEYHRAISPKMKSNMLGTFDLGRTDGYSISIPWIHTITSSWDLKFAYTYQTWDIEKSNIITDNTGTSWLEPRSESHFNIFDAALIYHY
jgi:hypothetical protein